MTTKILLLSGHNPPGKLAEAELTFTAGEPLAGYRLIGFSVWETKSGDVNITFPARIYSVNGEKRKFSLLRPALDPGPEAVEAYDAIRTVIADAYRMAKAEFDATSLGKKSKGGVR